MCFRRRISRVLAGDQSQASDWAIQGVVGEGADGVAEAVRPAPFGVALVGLGMEMRPAFLRSESAATFGTGRRGSEAHGHDCAVLDLLDGEAKGARSRSSFTTERHRFRSNIGAALIAARGCANGSVASARCAAATLAARVNATLPIMGPRFIVEVSCARPRSSEGFDRRFQRSDVVVVPD
jgi:hypothetical protein